MKNFVHMFEQVDSSTKTTVKVNALAEYFRTACDKDKVWAIAIMSHRRPKRPMTTKLMREWAAEISDVPLWLFEESYHIAGDLAETITLLCHGEKNKVGGSLSELIEIIIGLRGEDESEQKKVVQELWKSLDYSACFVFNKLLTGGFRMGISRKLMTRALAKATSIDEPIIAHKLMGKWNPATIDFQTLVLETSESEEDSRPYPFHLAYSIKESTEPLKSPKNWQAEWKWDGIRGQLIKRGGEHYVWTRGEELVTDRYPEFKSLVDSLPDGTVLDGEILAFSNGLPMDFRALQKRLGRKTVSKKLLTDIPVIFMAYDILEEEGKDIRQIRMEERRERMNKLISNIKCPGLQISPTIEFSDWKQLEESISEARERRCEGFMLKNLDSAYLGGRKKGSWWKWKVEPYSVDAVLTFAMRGHGRRANLYTDYTFGLWKDGELVTFAKAYSGLTDDEFQTVDAFVRKHSIQRFGPVRQVEPQLVFEIAFEGIAHSSRHKSGVAVRFPRIIRLRTDKQAKDADSLEHLKALIQ